MRVIKLMADYQCFPLWEASPGVVGNIDPQGLPISLLLKQRLIAWATKFDATLNMDDPASSSFDSEQVVSEFQQEGNVLAQCLQEELGANYVITRKL
jgi:hypothetical protein